MTTATSQPADEPTKLVPGSSRIISGKPFDTTLGKHGRQTLIGTLKGGYSFVPLDLPYRVMIGREVDKNIDLRDRLGQRILRTFALALKRFGSKDWDDKSLASKEVELGQLHMADVMYAAFVRLAEEYGDNWRINNPFEKCPHCKGAVPRVVGVDLMDLYCEGWDERPKAEYMLSQPWYLGGQKVKTVTMSAPQVNRALVTLSDDDFVDDLTRNLVWVAASIVEVNGSARVVNWDELTKPDQKTGRGMYNEDFDKMVALMNKLNGGPAVAIGWKHPACKEIIPIPVEWGKGFFVRSGA